MSNSAEFESEISNSVGTVSFWDLKQYGRTLRRIDNANKLCTDVCNMIQDRVEIEKAYSNSLHKWSVKWSNYLEGGVEYGTTKQCWLGFCREAEGVSEIHKEIRSRLLDEAQAEVRNWQREHYHKSALPPQHLKETKSLESDFEIAQKSWAKKLKKANQCKKDYHQQCKMVRSYEVHNKNAANDSNVSQEQLKKMEEKLRKTEKDREKYRSQYNASLQDLDGDSGRYVDEMTKVFDKAQEMERDRMTFFKSIFQRMQQILNISKNHRLTDIYKEFSGTISAIDADADINWWSHTYGADMPFESPVFEEYTVELHSISKKKHNASTDNDAGVTLTAVTQNSRPSSVHTPATENIQSQSSTPPPQHSHQNRAPPVSRPAAISVSSANTEPTSSPISASAVDPASPGSGVTGSVRRTAEEMNNDITGEVPVKPRRTSSLSCAFRQNSVNRPISITSDVSESTALSGSRRDSIVTNQSASIVVTDDKESPSASHSPSVEDGVQVRALYEYTGVEDDELTLKAGDIFWKLEDEDEQGWCKGRKDGIVGLYPANYAEPIE